MAEQEELTLEGAGMKAGFKGGQTMALLLAALVSAWVWYQFNIHEAKAEDKAKAQIAATEKLAEALSKQTKVIEQVEKTQKGVIYVLTLPPKEREQLKLVRPEILYEMQGYRER